MTQKAKGNRHQQDKHACDHRKRWQGDEKQDDPDQDANRAESDHGESTSSSLLTTVAHRPTVTDCEQSLATAGAV